MSRIVITLAGLMGGSGVILVRSARMWPRAPDWTAPPTSCCFMRQRFWGHSHFAPGTALATFGHRRAGRMDIRVRSVFR